jgi:hypothetical protein
MAAVLMAALAVGVGSIGGAPPVRAESAAVVPLTPVRATDTRPGTPAPGSKSRVHADGVLRVQVAGFGGVPGDASAVFLNVTAVGPLAAGHLTVFPCGGVPLASNVNYLAGDTAPNAVLAQLAPSGEVCVYSKADTDVIVDIAGYVPSGNPVPTTTTTTTLPADQLDAVLNSLTVASPDPTRPAYDRDDWDGWVDLDGDCVNTRHELLEARSEVSVTWNGCLVATGQWTDPYDAAVYTAATDVEIDHLVALAEAHRSGGWKWDNATKNRFNNDTTGDHLVVAGSSTNQSKSDSAPNQWMPPLPSRHCWYAVSWTSVKVRYSLTITNPEKAALTTALDTCPSGTTFGDLSPADITYTNPPPTTTTTTSTTTTTTVPSGSGTVQLVSCNAATELVTIRNPGSSTANLAGWTLHDEGNNHSVDLGTLQATLGAGQQLGILTGPAEPTAGQVKWKSQNVWNNDGDTAHVVSPGSVTATLTCTT